VDERLRTKLEARLGSPLSHVSAAGGGDINQTCGIELADGRRLFVKTHDAAPQGMYVCEARGLAWLAQTRTLRVPEVIVATEADAEGPACLVLETIELGRRSSTFDEALGAGLARLHQTGAASFGFDHDNYIALLPQANGSLATWPRFYAERRIGPQTQLALRSGRIAAKLARRLDTLCEKLEALLGPAEPPARLHGDLWSGNLLCDAQGQPCIIDPAVYGGHREMDLAMMRLFGGFSERVFAAYEAVYPLAPGHSERVPLYQLYPLLVHVNLFGGHYAAQVEQLLARWV
jgi:protein-ribulosamine 3-kinase